MRLSAFTIPVLSASTAFALSKSSRPYRRDILYDTCGSINSDLVLDEVIDSFGKSTVAGRIEACLCQSAVATFVESNAVAQAAVKLLGDAKVEAMISAMIKALPDSECAYPDHAQAICTDSNPCDFECTDGYLASPADKPTSCKCPNHLMECDGKCGHFKTCASKAPLSRRNNDPTCKLGLTMCGISGPSTGEPWKCVDINTEPTACGGCVKAAPYGSAPVNGLNCKNIEGVNPNAVACGGGRCIVNDCVKGFFVAPAKDSCIPLPATDSSKGTIPGASGSSRNAEGVVSRDGSTDELNGMVGGLTNGLTGTSA